MAMEIICSNEAGPLASMLRTSCYTVADVELTDILLSAIPQPPPIDALHAFLNEKSLWRRDSGRGSLTPAPYPTLELASDIPVPPPIPKEWRCKLAEADCDSGRGSNPDLPYCDVSDDEFSEAFPSRSASTSNLRFGASIPTPPTPPPIPAYLRNLSSSIAAAIPPELDIGLHLSMQNNDDYNMMDDISYYDYMDGNGYVCTICYSSRLHNIPSRSCCNLRFCRECMVNMVITNISDGLIYIHCPNPECDTPIEMKEILSCLTGHDELRERYERMRLEAEGNEGRKACPNCCHITEHKVPSHRFKKLREQDVRIHCEKCSHDWCFNCHAPWHTDLTCSTFQRGDHQFHKWTKGRTGGGIANCHKCPFCRVYIQRSTGCDYMTCNRCNTHFCYKCGDRLTNITGRGDHYYTGTSVIGCKFNYKANDPLQRKAVRGSYLGAKLAMLTGYPFLFVGGVVIVVVAGAVILPVYGGYKLYKIHKNSRKNFRPPAHAA